MAVGLGGWHQGSGERGKGTRHGAGGGGRGDLGDGEEQCSEGGGEGHGESAEGEGLRVERRQPGLAPEMSASSE